MISNNFAEILMDATLKRILKRIDVIRKDSKIYSSGFHLCDIFSHLKSVGYGLIDLHVFVNKIESSLLKKKKVCYTSDASVNDTILNIHELRNVIGSVNKIVLAERFGKPCDADAFDRCRAEYNTMADSFISQGKDLLRRLIKLTTDQGIKLDKILLYITCLFPKDDKRESLIELTSDLLDIDPAIIRAVGLPKKQQPSEPNQVVTTSSGKELWVGHRGQEELGVGIDLPIC